MKTQSILWFLVGGAILLILLAFVSVTMVNAQRTTLIQQGVKKALRTSLEFYYKNASRIPLMQNGRFVGYVPNAYKPCAQQLVYRHAVDILKQERNLPPYQINGLSLIPSGAILIASTNVQYTLLVWGQRNLGVQVTYQGHTYLTKGHNTAC